MSEFVITASGQRFSAAFRNMAKSSSVIFTFTWTVLFMPSCIKDFPLLNNVSKRTIRTHSPATWPDAGRVQALGVNCVKIIFSRKGFDSRNGGVASPIFPDGRMRSLPIPDKNDKVNFEKVKCDLTDLGYRATGLGSLVQDLTFKPRKSERGVKGTDTCHLDPDLIRSDLTHRKTGWLPMFGQGNAACAHLLNNGVREGDLFLFFGWFHPLQKVNGQFKFDPERQDAHVIFGWLQIGEIWCGFNANADIPKWAWYHPHVHGDPDGLCNLKKPVDAVFIAKRRLALPGLRTQLPGGACSQNTIRNFS